MQVLHRLDLNDVIVQNVLLASIPQEEAELPALVGQLSLSVACSIHTLCPHFSALAAIEVHSCRTMSNNG